MTHQHAQTIKRILLSLFLTLALVGIEALAGI